MSDAQWTFIRGELLSLSMRAALARGPGSPTYNSEAGAAQRKAVRCTLKACVCRLSDQYGCSVQEPRHTDNIVGLACDISKRHGQFLAKGRFRIGRAQKVLNLYLKYLWCLGKIPEPPHCPIDSNVISWVPELADVCWTRMDSREEYVRCITAIKERANGQSLACWECAQFNAEK